MTRYADGPTTEVAIHVDAPPDVVWAYVSDITVPVRFSRELQPPRVRALVEREPLLHRAPAAGIESVTDTGRDQSIDAGARSTTSERINRSRS